MARQAGARDEHGFALLLVFVLAAMIAISLYLEMPRVVFEQQRAKEQLLIDRGQEYVTAVRRFYRQLGRFPATLDDLESTNNMRFLRKRYVDPMTGKADWRLIHVGPGGQILDSLVQKPFGQGTGASGTGAAPGSGTGTGMGTGTGTSGGTQTTEQGQAAGPAQASGFGFDPASMGTANQNGSTPDPNAAGETNPGLAKRPSDRTLPPVNGLGGPAPNQTDPNAPLDPNALGPNGEYPPVGFPPTQSGGTTGQQNYNQPGVAGQTGIPGQPGMPGQTMPAQMGQPGFSPTGVPGQSPFPQGVSPQGAFPQGAFPQGAFPQGGQGGPGFPNGAFTSGGAGGPGGAAANPALSAIQQQLTSPAAGGVTASPFGGNNQLLGGGIVGVASKSKMSGIKEFDKHKKYAEWEFIFDMKKANGMPGQAGMLPGFGGQPGQPGQTPTTGAPGSSNSPFGGSSTAPTGPTSTPTAAPGSPAQTPNQ